MRANHAVIVWTRSVPPSDRLNSGSAPGGRFHAECTLNCHTPVSPRLVQSDGFHVAEKLCNTRGGLGQARVSQRLGRSRIDRNAQRDVRAQIVSRSWPRRLAVRPRATPRPGIQLGFGNIAPDEVGDKGASHGLGDGWSERAGASAPGRIPPKYRVTMAVAFRVGRAGSSGMGNTCRPRGARRRPTDAAIGASGGSMSRRSRL